MSRMNLAHATLAALLITGVTVASGAPWVEATDNPLVRGAITSARRLPFGPGGLGESLSAYGPAPQEQCAQWDVTGRWDLQMDNYFASKPETGRVEFRQTGTTLTAAVFITGNSGQPMSGRGTLVGNQLSLGFGVRDPYSKDGGGPVETWTGTVSATSVAGSGERVQSQWSQGFQFNWKATPNLSYQLARCVSGAAVSPTSPGGAVPSRTAPPECQGVLQARLFGRIYHDGIGAMHDLDDKTKPLFTESSFEQADDAYYQIAREKTDLAEGYGHLAGSLAYLAELRFTDGKWAYPTLRGALPIIYTMLRKSKDEIDYLTALDRLLSYILVLDNKARCD